MQKALQQVARARAASARRAAQLAETRERNEIKRAKGVQTLKKRWVRTQVEQASQAYKDAWNLGPLAPRLDVGEKAENHGIMPMAYFGLEKRRKRDRLQHAPFAEKDRVVVLKGQDKGKIGVVQDVDLETHSVRVAGLNEMYYRLPAWYKKQTGVSETEAKMARGLSIDDVSLVYPLKNPKTGIVEDMIIDRVELRNPLWDHQTRSWITDRVVPDTGVAIPWPIRNESAKEEAYGNDTLEADVDEVTWSPLLLYPPVPINVIDELRNKDSKYRLNLTEQQKEKLKLREERVERRKQLIQTMHTPILELAAKRQAQKLAVPKRELSTEELERIGQVMVTEAQFRRAKGGQPLGSIA